MTTTTMTATATPAHKAGLTPIRPPLVTRAFAVRLISVIGASASFYLLLSVAPRYAAPHGGGAAGLASAALLIGSVAGEILTPALGARSGSRRTLAIGLALLGAPALVLTLTANPTTVVAVCAVRGIGFGLACVAGGALTAELIPPARRGEGLALVGLVGGIPATVALPAGLVLADHVGYAPVFVAAALCALGAALSVPALPKTDAATDTEEGTSVLSGVRTRELRRPATVFGTTAVAAGVLVTFLPLAVSHGSGNVVAAALLVHSAASTIARWAAGRYGDRHGSARLLRPALIVSASGVLMLVVTGNPVTVIAGAAVFGIGFGACQNASLSMMYERVAAARYSTVSALWNFAYDAGMGAGAGAFGMVCAHTGYPIAFALTAVLMLTALRTARRA
jgi:predicted MFS family arabinose efflux permease